MGRHKFRLSDMIPNAWFFKLRDMRARGGGGSSAASPRVAALRPPPSTPRKGAPAAWHPHRASHYYTPRAGDLVLGSPSPPLHTIFPKASDTRFPPLQLSPPRRSSTSRRRHHHHRRRSVKLAAPPSASSSSGVASSSPASTTAAACRCGGRRPELVVVQAPDTPPCRRDIFVGYSSDDDDDFVKKPTFAAGGAHDKLDGGKVITSATDIIIDLRTKRRPTEKTLPPIMTKPPPANKREPDGWQLEDKHIDVLAHATRRAASPVVPPEQSKLNKPRRSVSSSSPAARRLKTRANTPRLASAKKCRSPTTTARSPAPTKLPPPPLAESFAVVKSSRDPRRDFRESMEEMITENGIRSAADLEDLLACYLSLNAVEYHDLIVEVFEHIWVTLCHVKV